MLALDFLKQYLQAQICWRKHVSAKYLYYGLIMEFSLFLGFTLTNNATSLFNILSHV